MGNGEWGRGPIPHTLNFKQRKISASNVEKYEDRILSGPGYLETRHGNRGGLLSSDQNLSERRVVWNDIPNSQSKFIGSVEYRGGIWQREHKRLHSFSANRPG